MMWGLFLGPNLTPEIRKLEISGRTILALPVRKINKYPKGGEKVKERAKRVITSAAAIFFIIALVTPVISASDSGSIKDVPAPEPEEEEETPVIEPENEPEIMERTPPEDEVSPEGISPGETKVDTQQVQDDPEEADSAQPESEMSPENIAPEEPEADTQLEQEDPVEDNLSNPERPYKKGKGNAYGKGQMHKLLKGK